MSHSWLESQTLELMSEVAELKVRLKHVEEERNAYRDKYNVLQSEILELNEQLVEKDNNIQALKAQVVGIHQNSNGSNGHHHKENEYEALQSAISDLLIQNDEKDLKIDELRKAVATYQRVEEIILSSRSNRPKSEDADTIHSTGNTPRHDRMYSASPISNDKTNGNLLMSLSPGSAPPVPKHGVSVQRSNSYDAARFNRIISDDGDEVDDQAAPATAVSSIHLEQWSREKKQKGSCTSLPRDYNNKVDMSALISSTVEKDGSDSDVFIDGDDLVKEPKKRRGIRAFFSRMKRSTSQEAVNGERPFKRGGVRATAGARLGGHNTRKSTSQVPKSDSFITPFDRWTTDQVAVWLFDLGLSMYVNDCRRWCKGGQHMLDSTKHEIEKELRIHHPLHKKKLQLALHSIKSGNRKEQFVMNGLRSEWIAKWLDDIGLPQYKDQFFEARIDGRMLNQLTVDDLLYMKINNALHHLSIRRGIEVLRNHNFNLGTLKRRPSAERCSEYLSSTLNGSATRDENSERDVSLWTNHRVMEWLRMIDLSEYAANLRGSGVHGALIMLEPRFTVEHLADILVIPPNKTLLRRHLSAHFVNLVGQKTQAKKREVEQVAGMALTLNMKVKTKRTNIFRRGRPASAYVCPVEKIEPIDTSSKAEDKRIKDAVAMYKKEISKRESSRKELKDS